MAAVTVDSMKMIALALIIGFFVIGILCATLITKVMGKLLSVAALGLLAFAVWTQRESLQDCAERAREQVGTQAENTTCNFFGKDVHVPNVGR